MRKNYGLNPALTSLAFHPFDRENFDMTLHVGLCGAGIGGLAAAIAIAQCGARVTVLEAAEELGEVRTPSRNLLSQSGLTAW